MLILFSPVFFVLPIECLVDRSTGFWVPFTILLSLTVVLLNVFNPNRIPINSLPWQH